MTKALRMADTRPQMSKDCKTIPIKHSYFFICVFNQNYKNLITWQPFFSNSRTGGKLKRWNNVILHCCRINVANLTHWCHLQLYNRSATEKIEDIVNLGAQQAIFQGKATYVVTCWLMRPATS